MKKLIAMGLVLISMVAVSTNAAESAKKVDKKSATKTKDMVVVKEATGQIKWTGFGVGKSHTGTVQLKSGTVDMKNENIVGGTFVFDMGTLTSPDSAKLVGHLKSEDFFAAEKFTTATLKITNVTALKPAKAGDATHEITGDLTIKTKTNPITFKAIVTNDGKHFKATGSAEITDRTKYDIVYNSKQFGAVSKLGDKLIEDNIKIDIDVMTK